MLKLKPKYRKLWWDLVTVAALAGVVYSTIEYVEYAGPWKALLMVPLMILAGYLAVEVLYPLWFRD